ncbi:unnamed protein product [Triticum turgidum subsp. durum]|uniref:Peptidase S54 rhomboid domain-containing protein n=1 Tax=Triticum turgidum subsp. durum TaxID=4567 RepID=A0A9R0TRR4_TRITD|nr:unnamed protein product [Triticum turgidum subsp. durum]
MAPWLLLPSFPWPPPPPPGSSSGRGGGGGGGDGGDWKPNVVTAIAGVHLGRSLRRRLAGLLSSPEVRSLDVLPRIGDIWFGGLQPLDTHHVLGALGNVYSASFVCSSAFFGGNRSGGRYVGSGNLQPRRPRGINSKKRLWTNVLLAVNILAYIAQIASQGKLIMWGAKFNCFSLNSIGPTVELVTGPKRFLAVYFTSALAGSLMSYRYCQSPSVGASGAIFGLKSHIFGLIQGMGLLSRGIDNWGHLGGLLGGVAAAWFLGPAWQNQYVAKDGRMVFKDRAPIHQLIGTVTIVTGYGQAVLTIVFYIVYLSSIGSTSLIIICVTEFMIDPANYGY